MSLEAKIEKLTVAVEALTQAVLARVTQVQSPSPASPPAAAASPAAGSNAQATASPLQPSPDTQVRIDKANDVAALFKEGSDLVLKHVAAGGRDAAVALLAKFGAAKVPAMDPKHIADYVREAKGALAALSLAA